MNRLRCVHDWCRVDSLEKKKKIAGRPASGSSLFLGTRVTWLKTEMCPQNSRFEMGTLFILKLHQAQTWVVDYINFSYLGVTCMSTAVDTHTHTPPAPPAHQEFRVKAIYIARVPPASMGDEGYPQDIHIGDLEADPGAVQAQLLFVAQHHTARTREFAAEYAER